MDRNREARRTSIVGSNGFNRRRHRTSSLRGSPDEDMGLEVQESMRLRERVKKDRDRDRDRERDLRERDSRDKDLRDRDSRERSDMVMHCSKRRRNERLMNQTGNDESSEESVNDDEDEDNNASTTTNHHHHNNFSFSQIHHNHNINNHNMTNCINNNLVTSGSNLHLQQRKSFPLPSTTSNYTKANRGPPVWRSGDEVISVSVPRKARSASTKRSHYWISSNGNNNIGGAVGDGEQIHRPTSDSPARHAVVPTSNQAPMSPPSLGKKLKPSVNNNNMVHKLKPPKAVPKPSSSNPEELEIEIEIAEVLYGLMTQSQGPSSKKDEVDRSTTDAKSLNSFSISNCVPKSSPLTAIAPKRKRPRQVPENLIYGNRNNAITAEDADQTPKTEISSPTNLEKISASAAENSSETGLNSVVSQVPAAAQPSELESAAKFDSESKPSLAELRDISSKVVAKEDFTAAHKMKEASGVVRTEGILSNEVSTSLQTSRQKEEKFEIDLMAPPKLKTSSPEREGDLDSRSTATTDQKPIISAADVELKPLITSKDREDGDIKKDQLVVEDDEKSKRTREETKPVKANDKNIRKFDTQLDLEKPERDGTCNGGINALGNKLLQHQKLPVKANREDPPGQSMSTLPLPLPLSLASWSGGVPPMGCMGAPFSMDGTTVITPARPIQPLFSQPERKRCTTHCHIAKNIYYQEQFKKMNPYKGLNSAPDNKTQSLLKNSKGSLQTKPQQQVLVQQALPSGAPSNLLGPAFIFPLNQQQTALSVRPSTGKSQTSASPKTSGSSAPSTALNFSYPNMGGVNETQYLAILQNNGYPFPIPAAPNFRGPAPPVQTMPLFNGSFYPQLQQSSSPVVSQPQQIANASNSSSSSQKHHQRPQSSSGTNNGSSSRARQVDGENNNSEDVPSSESHVPAVNIYGPNFMMPIHPQNFAMMTPFASGNSQGEKKSNQPQGVSLGIESLTPHHGLAMSFGSGIDMSSMVQNHVMYQNSPEAARQNIQMMAAAAAVAAQAAQKKNVKVSEDSKSCNGDVSNNPTDDERKGLVGKSQGGVGQSIAFTRSVLPDHTNNATQQRSARPSNANVVGEISVQNAHVQAQNQQQQLAANNRIKVPVTSNGTVFSEHMSSSTAKYQNVLSGFSQNLIQTNNGVLLQSQSPQWKGSASARTSTSHSLASQGSTLKGNSQHSSRNQPLMHAQISFGGNQKPSTASQGQAQTGANQIPSPTTSSVSRGASGSPRTSVSASANSKNNQGSLSVQQPKNSISIPVQKSPSVLGNPHVSSSTSNNGAKPQIQLQNSQHQQQQQQLMLKKMQQGHLIFSNPLTQVQLSPNPSGPTGYYMHQQKRLDKHQQSMQATSSSGMVSLSPSLTNTTNTNDPAKAIADATNNVKNSGLPSQGVFNASQFSAQPGGTIIPGFSYIHPIPAGVPTKQPEQKQHAGNDSLHQWQPEKK